MDPVTAIVSAVAAGALAGLGPTAEAAVKDAYAGVRALIQRKYPSVDVTPLETDPGSETRRTSIARDLTVAGAEQDADLLDAAAALAELLRSHAPGAGPAIGVDLEEVRAAALRIGSVASEGTGVRVRKGDFSGDIQIGMVDAGKRSNPPNP